jgi:hypothetical protein
MRCRLIDVSIRTPPPRGSKKASDAVYNSRSQAHGRFCMKEKKRFGKLNAVDFVILLVIAAAAVFFAVRYFGAGDGGAGDTVEIQYTVTIDALPASLYEAAAATLPDSMISDENTVSGAILSSVAEPVLVESLETNNNYNSNTAYTVIPGEEEAFVKAVFTCRATVSSSSVSYKLGAQDLRIGRLHILKTKELELVGTLTSMTVGAPEQP